MMLHFDVRQCLHSRYNDMNRDLTTGKPSAVLWRFCLPLFGSILFQQLYNIADSFVAGKFIGEEALAAVGNSYEITLIFIAFAFGVNIACSVVTARYYGAKDFLGVRTTVSTTLISSGALCLVLMALGKTRLGEFKAIPFGPFLALAAWGWMTWGWSITLWYWGGMGL